MLDFSFAQLTNFSGLGNVAARRGLHPWAEPRLAMLWDQSATDSTCMIKSAPGNAQPQPQTQGSSVGRVKSSMELGRQPGSALLTAKLQDFDRSFRQPRSRGPRSYTTEVKRRFARSHRMQLQDGAEVETSSAIVDTLKLAHNHLDNLAGSAPVAFAVIRRCKVAAAVYAALIF